MGTALAATPAPRFPGFTDFDGPNLLQHVSIHPRATWQYSRYQDGDRCDDRPRNKAVLADFIADFPKVKVSFSICRNALKRAVFYN